MMTSKKLPLYFTGFILILLLCTGVSMADRLLNQTPEVQGITTTTNANAVGLVMETDAISWQDSNYGLVNSTLAIPGYSIAAGPFILDIPEIYFSMVDTRAEARSTVTYDETTVAMDGATAYTKTLSLSTANKVAGQSNIKADKSVTYVGGEGGKMTSSENILMDNAGAFDYTRSNYLCPFAAQQSMFLPDYCNIAKMGSSVDVSQGSLVTSTSERSVSATSDAAAEIDHSISLTGIGNSPAIGSADASMSVHIQNGRLLPLGVLSFSNGDHAYVYKRAKSEDLTYTEKSAASGVIASFAKTMQYQSGMKLS
jgi:hypothetical protein